MGLKEKQQPCRDYAGRSCGVCLCLYCVLCEWTLISCASMTTWHASVHITYSFCVCQCVFLCGWVSFCTTEWVSVVVLGMQTWPAHQKQCVMLERLYSGHRSLTVLPSISACLQWHMPSLPSIWKAFSMSLTLSQRETSTFSLLGIQPVRNTKAEHYHCVASGGTMSDSDIVCGFFLFFGQKIDRLLWSQIISNIIECT